MVTGHPVEQGGWSALLDGRARGTAVDRVRAIAAALRSVTPAEPSLAGGAAGVALFFAYLAQVTGDEADGEAALRFLEYALEQQDGGTLHASLFEGFTGAAWVLAHTTGPEDVDPNDAVDEALLALLEPSPWTAHYDLISGLVGFGVYALERLPNPRAIAAIERIVAHLERSAERDDTGITWWTSAELVPVPQRDLFPAGYWNFGVAHGVPGVIAFLAHARAAGVASQDAGRLAEEAVAWLLSRRLPEDQPSRFQSVVARNGATRPAGLAWCYGDPGVAAALLVAGRREEAIALALAAGDRSRTDVKVVEAGLCHGAAGLGHLFNRLHQATGDDRLAAAARHWLDRALDLPVREAGFLEGAAGLGLALLAAATDVEPAWDRILLLSGPTRG